MVQIQWLDFLPFKGLSSPHLQTIIPTYFPVGSFAASHSLHVELDDKDKLSCEVSIPEKWTEKDPTIALIHGLGGSHDSTYMRRLAKKLFLEGKKAVRINLRGCGSGKNLSSRPYCAGTSDDIFKILQFLKGNSPLSKITLIGFSLGGNIALKLAGELGNRAGDFLERVISVCPPIDLKHSLNLIQNKKNSLYHAYYLKYMCKQAQPWIKQKIRSLFEFDELITAPVWGYQGAYDYYEKCSSIRFLPRVSLPTHILFAEDDPFISMEPLKGLSLTKNISVCATKKGGHMGFFGYCPKMKGPYWLDEVLLHWVNGNNSSY